MSIIEKNQKVTISYTLSTLDEVVLEKADEGNPLSYLHGHLNLVPGLEEALEGHHPGDELSVILTPEDAYGPYQDDLLLEIPREDLANLGHLEAGMEIELLRDDEQEEEDSWKLPTDPSELYEKEDIAEEIDDEIPSFYIIREVQEDIVILDGNHPLAGQTLKFDVRVIDVDSPLFEEIEQGYLNENEEGDASDGNSLF
jgi:FKBP-type peptidyl-prolyl cis-trans isomerase SlyD